jgi:hypothetical protein
VERTAALRVIVMYTKSNFIKVAGTDSVTESRPAPP